MTNASCSPSWTFTKLLSRSLMSDDLKKRYEEKMKHLFWNIISLEEMMEIESEMNHSAKESHMVLLNENSNGGDSDVHFLYEVEQGFALNQNMRIFTPMLALLN
ncbi:hypothetical protein RF11_15816 [Thelohanellus kitauei]|uniref:Uncharacterized protein n=1 Tax=Thelohanellus kitauei TaxID=669202 RepID=A0A0C2JAZ2_THEKT|nr:hypothetical protein RF11_15816 [Thelohanellus kitauei]